MYIYRSPIISIRDKSCPSELGSHSKVSTLDSISIIDMECLQLDLISIIRSSWLRVRKILSYKLPKSILLYSLLLPVHVQVLLYKAITCFGISYIIIIGNGLVLRSNTKEITRLIFVLVQL